MHPTSVQAFYDELEKIAITRMEREIQAGNLQRSKVVPGVIDARKGFLGAVGRKSAREKLRAPATPSAAALARTRKLNELVFENQMRNPGALGPGIEVSRDPFGAPATAHSPLSPKAQISMPTRSSQLVRAMGQGSMAGKIKANLIALPQLADDSLAAKAQKAAVPAPHPMDATLNRAILGHEKGEAQLITAPERPFGLAGKAPITIQASHAGVKPIFEEQLGTVGDPAARHQMDLLRKSHPDDVLVQKLMRQAGARPDAPLPVGGRAERTVDRMLHRNINKLAPGTRAKSLAMTLAGKNVSYVPPAVTESTKSLLGSVTDLSKAWSARDLKGGISAVRRGLPSLRQVGRFVSKGRIG